MPLIYFGDSMLMMFKPGDLLISRPLDFADFQVGDVVCFRTRDKARTVHRIIRRDELHLFTMGDNNPRPDPDPVTADQLPELITGYQRRGKTSRVYGGWPGRLTFRWHRFLKTLILIARMPTVPFAHKITDKIGIPVTKKICFNGEVCYFKGKRLIAKRIGTHHIAFLNPFERLIFRVIDPDVVRRGRNGQVPKAAVPDQPESENTSGPVAGPPQEDR